MAAKLDDVAPLAEAFLLQYRGEPGAYQKVADLVAAKAGLRVSARTVRRWARSRGLAPNATPKPSAGTSPAAVPKPGVKIEILADDRIGTVIDGLIALGADRTATPSVRVNALDKAGYFALLLEGRMPSKAR